jgi:ferredoxin
MANIIYQKLAHHLDNLPGGFPSTVSGVELRILRKLFTREEAELAPFLTLLPEEPRVVARRAKITPEEASQRLEVMAKKGLILRMGADDSQTRYAAAQFVIGIWEFHVNDLDTEFVSDMQEYMPTLFEQAWKYPQLRTIPVGRSISSQIEVLPYEKAEELVSTHKKFLVAPCICRREHHTMGIDCKMPEETCLVFGFASDYYRRNGLGRVIDLEETLDILKEADKKGLVLQPTNSKEIVNICCCCGCCCGVLRNVKRHPKPASIVSTPFVAVLNSETCKGCGACAKRCQMEALKLAEEKAVLDTDRCIGCGLCVSTCPTGSLALSRKPKSEQPKLPKDMIQSSIRLGQARGKLGLPNLIGMQLKSKFDRLLATR